MKKNLEDAIDRWRNNHKEKETRTVNVLESRPSIGEFELHIRLSHQIFELSPGDATSASARMNTTIQSLGEDIIPDTDVLLFEQTVNKLESDFYRTINIQERPAKRDNSEELRIAQGFAGE